MEMPRGSRAGGRNPMPWPRPRTASAAATTACTDLDGKHGGPRERGSPRRRAVNEANNTSGEEEQCGAGEAGHAAEAIPMWGPLREDFRGPFKWWLRDKIWEATQNRSSFSCPAGDAISLAL
jgi:hypothetical protein